jgi:hypothetical protein
MNGTEITEISKTNIHNIHKITYFPQNPTESEAVTLLTHIMEMPVSNLGRGTGYPGQIVAFLSSFM